jgi:integrase
MKGLISNTWIKTLKPGVKAYDARDGKLVGFLIRVNPSGKMNYVCEYKRGRRVNIGRVGVLTPAQARELAKEILGNASKGIYPEKKSAEITLKTFIEKEYQPWVLVHRKSGNDAIKVIQRNFYPLFANKPLNEIDLRTVDRWRTQRLEQGRKTATVNRACARFKAALSKAVEWDILDSHPLKNLKALPEDATGKLRFLSTEEEIALRAALNQREIIGCNKRDKANKWRAERSYTLMPDFKKHHFFDYLKPMILLSINTGLRRGEILHLTWEQVAQDNRLLTLHGYGNKRGKTRHLPLNSEAFDVLSCWQSQSDTTGLIFESKTGGIINDFRKSWARLLLKAGIENFRWHDLRHHFASRLVMNGIDLNTVRELLGHADIKMTLRYAHLAPEHKAQAIESIVRKEAKPCPLASI